MSTNANKRAFKHAVAQTLNVAVQLVDITATGPVTLQQKQLRQLRAAMSAPDVAFSVGASSPADASSLVAMLASMLAPPASAFKAALVNSGAPSFANLTGIAVTRAPTLTAPTAGSELGKWVSSSSETEAAPAATIAKPRSSSSEQKSSIGAAAGAALGGSLLLCAGGYAFYRRRALGSTLTSSGSAKDFRSLESARLNAMADAAAQYATALAAADEGVGPVSPRSVSRRLSRNSSLTDSLTRRAAVSAYTELSLDET
jgi:hypothetical protein